MPNGIEDYIHRIGRTGRAGAKGTAYSYITPDQGKLGKDLVKILVDAKQVVLFQPRYYHSRRGLLMDNRLSRTCDGLTLMRYDFNARITRRDDTLVFFSDERVRRATISGSKDCGSQRKNCKGEGTGKRTLSAPPLLAFVGLRGGQVQIAISVVREALQPSGRRCVFETVPDGKRLRGRSSELHQQGEESSARSRFPFRGASVSRACPEHEEPVSREGIPLQVCGDAECRRREPRVESGVTVATTRQPLKPSRLHSDGAHKSFDSSPSGM